MFSRGCGIGVKSDGDDGFVCGAVGEGNARGVVAGGLGLGAPVANGAVLGIEAPGAGVAGGNPMPPLDESPCSAGASSPVCIIAV